METIAIEFITGPINQPDPHIENTATIPDAGTWLKSMFTAKYQHFIHQNDNRYEKLKKIASTIDTESLRLMPNESILNKSNYTHQGLIQYVYTAWAHELGVILKPEFFFFTIVSEIKNFSMKNGTFGKLFSEHTGKTRIEIVGLTIDKLVDVIHQSIPCQKLVQILIDTTFKSAPAHFPQVMGITLADMGVPYLNHYSTFCGIPKIAVLGCVEDWNKILVAINRLIIIFADSTSISKYLACVSNTILALIQSAFITKDVDYYKNMFSYSKNLKCESGHEEIMIDGWIRNMYIEPESYINRYASHLNCLPYADEDDPINKKYYFYSTGLTSSTIVDDYLCPDFNIIHCEIIHPEASEIFNVLARREV